MRIRITQEGAHSGQNHDVYINLWGFPTTDMLADVLAALIRAPDHTESIFLQSINVVNDISPVLAALEDPRLKQLRSIDISRCRLPPNAMPAMGEALGKLPMLQNVSCDQMTWKMLAGIVNNTSSTVESIRLLLPSTQDLTGVSEVCDFILACGKLTNLKKLLFRIPRSIEPHYFETMAEMIRKTTSLQDFTCITADTQESIKCLNGIAVALRENQSLTRLRIQRSRADRISKKSVGGDVLNWSAIHDALKRNFLLTDFIIDSRLLFDSENTLALNDHQLAVYFYLHFNNVARQYYGTRRDALASIDAWFDVISEACKNNDVSVIYFLLHENPSLLAGPRNIA